MGTNRAGTGGILWAQVIAMMVLGMVFAQALGWIFSDEPWSRFVSIGLVFGLSSIASVRKRHLASLLIFGGGILWFLQIVRLDSAGWIAFVGWALVVAGLIVWVFFSHGRVAASDSDAESEDGESVIGGGVTETSADEIHLSGKATSARRIVTSQSFRGGEVSVSLGTLEIDLTSAQLAEEGASLALSSQMGNLTLRVPADWTLQIDGSFKMGAVNDDRPEKPTEGPELRLNVNTSMGNIHITN